MELVAFRNRLRALLPVLVVLGFLAFLPFHRQRLARADIQARLPGVGAQMAGGAAHDFELPTSRDRRVSLRAQRGRLVFINYWASWCAPCLEELPALMDLAGQFQGEEITWLAVSQDTGWDEALAPFDGANSNLEIALDPGGGLAQLSGTEKLPESYLIDRDGRLLARWVNVQAWNAPQMVAFFRAVLGAGI